MVSTTTASYIHAAPMAPGEKRDESLLVPVIRLSPYHAIQEARVYACSSSDDESLPENDHQQIEVSGELVVQDDTALYTMSSPLDDNSDSVLKRKRAAFLSATVLKNTPEEKLGVTITTDSQSGCPVISSIHSQQEGGLLVESPFKAGDIIVSINNKSCKGLPKSKVAKLLKSITGMLTIVVENPNDGDPRLVESMVMKSAPDAKTGLGIGTGTRRYGQRYARVASLNRERVFAESLLSRKDYILSVNGISCENASSETVANLVGRSEKYVTVVAERKPETGIVVAMAA